MLLVDTGVLYALADRDDAWHRRSVDLLRRSRERLLAPASVIPEVAYLVHTRLGSAAERRFIRSVADRELAIEPLADVDWERALELMGDYDALGFVDASVIAIAERLRVARIATTDRRHFGIVRPRHRAAFELVP
jgi:predicted nucleic acid-binding protein